MSVTLYHRGSAHIGRLTVGDSGINLGGIKTGTVNIDPASIAAGETLDVDVTITGVAAGDIVHLQPPSTFEADLIVSHMEVTANTVTVRLYNPTAGAINGTDRTWRYLWHDLT